MKLPPLLQAARERYEIPDGAFQTCALFDRAFVWQIPAAERFKDSTLIKPETAKAREKSQAPRGVLISAGLQALDYLVSNGCRGLGADVEFVRLSPWRMPVDLVDGKDVELVVCRATDLVGDRWLAHALYVTGEAEIVLGKDGRHALRVGENVYEPLTPESSADY